MHGSPEPARKLLMADPNDQPATDATEVQLLERWKNGDESAAKEIVERYVTRLIALARTRLSAKLRRRVDPEDVVQSAYRSFFRHAADDRYVLDRSGDLWRLLAAIVMNKLHGQVEFHTAQKRSIRMEESQASPGADNASFINPAPFAKQPTVSEVLGVNEELQRTMHDLPENHQKILEMRLQGHNVPEIAEEIGRSERTVRRALENVRNLLEHRLSGDGQS